MTWNNQECYVLYTQYLEYLKNSLGISQVDFYTKRPELLPYYTKIVEYLNKRLIILGTEDIKSKIIEILDIFEHGADLICDGNVISLADEVDISYEDPEYMCCRFVFAWTNALSTLCLRLKFQYAHLFEPEYDPFCCRCGAIGETYEDYESWTSGVFPNDEAFDRANYYRNNSSWGIRKTRYCECYRHSSENGEGE
jgi:hypothetical protein